MYTKNIDDPGYELNTHLADAPSVLIDYQPLLPTHDKAFSSTLTTWELHHNMHKETEKVVQIHWD